MNNGRQYAARCLEKYFSKTYKKCLTFSESHGSISKSSRARHKTNKDPGVAKFGIALEWGSRGLEFESRHSDQKCRNGLCHPCIFSFEEEIRTFKCNSPVDCCLPPAGWRQHHNFSSQWEEKCKRISTLDVIKQISTLVDRTYEKDTAKWLCPFFIGALQYRKPIFLYPSSRCRGR